MLSIYLTMRENFLVVKKYCFRMSIINLILLNFVIANFHPPLIDPSSSIHPLFHPPMASNNDDTNQPQNIKQQTKYKIKLVQVIVRPGRRTPLYKLPLDNKLSWPQPQLGQLTFEGKQELIDLGKQFRARYVLSNNNQNLLPEQFQGVGLSFIYARSTDTERALETAQMFLKGLYPDAVVPVRVATTEEDFLLLGSRLCSKMDKRRQLVQEELNRSGKYDELFQQLQKHTGIEHVSMSNFRTIADSLLTLKDMNALQNKKMPAKLSSIPIKTLEKTKDLLDKYFHDVYSKIDSGRMACGNLLRGVIERIVSITEYAKNAGENIPPRFVLYSGNVFIFETVAFDAIVCNKIKERRRQERCLADENPNAFLSQLEATTRNYSEKNDQNVHLYKRKQQKRSCYVLCIGLSGILTCFILLLAFGIEWNEWPIVAFILCTLIAVESSAIAAVFVHAKFFDDRYYGSSSEGYYSRVPTLDPYFDDRNNQNSYSEIETDEEINNHLNESDFGKVTDIL
eukprot:g9785.t1